MKNQVIRKLHFLVQLAQKSKYSVLTDFRINVIFSTDSLAEVEELEQQQTQPSTETSLRKELNLEWVESEWFQVWLKLARGERS